jgi:hypothetical protein
VDAQGRDAAGHLAEDFGLLENLMIAVGVEGRVIYATSEAAERTQQITGGQR